MILKVLTNKRDKFRFVLRYMLEDRSRLYDNGGKPFLITHNMKGKGIDIASWTKQFQENEKLRMRKRRKDGIMLYHEILSFNSRDSKSLAPEKIEDIIRQYIHLRNPNGSYVICVHRDRDHVHAHICASAIDRFGKNMRLSRMALADLKKNIQQYQISKYPELSHSIVRHGGKVNRISQKEQQVKQRIGKLSQREMVHVMVESCYKKSKSMDDFYTRLQAQGLNTYVRGGKVYGVEYSGRKFRFKTLGIKKEQNKTKNRVNELRRIRKQKRIAKDNTKSLT